MTPSESVIIVSLPGATDRDCGTVRSAESTPTDWLPRSFRIVSHVGYSKTDSHCKNQFD